MIRLNIQFETELQKVLKQKKYIKHKIIYSSNVNVYFLYQRKAVFSAQVKQKEKELVKESVYK